MKRLFVGKDGTDCAGYRLIIETRPGGYVRDTIVWPGSGPIASRATMTIRPRWQAGRRFMAAINRNYTLVAKHD